MKTTACASVLVVLNALILNFSSLGIGAGQSKNSNSHGGGQAPAHVGKKGSANNNAQWSADPERGWVRADERQKLNDPGRLSLGSAQNNDKQKVKGKANKF